MPASRKHETPEEKRERARLRQRKCRAGKKPDVVRPALPRGHLVDMLVDAGHLREWDEDDDRAIADALARFLKLRG